MRGMNRNLGIAFVLLISLGYPAKSGAVDFAPPKSYPVGTSPSAVVVGDFNSDGKSDIAVANSGSANVSVLLGNGDGTFQPAVNFDAGLSPGSVAIGDFNGDGKLDLALFQAGNTDNATAGAISILLGNGDGRFQTPKTTALTVIASAMAVADFNADKKSDLAVSNVDPSTNDVTVGIFLGKSDGTFQSAKSFPMPFGANGVLAVADFNNDSKPDFAIGGSGGISVFLGQGDGTFQLGPAAPTVDGEVQSIQAGDVNGDGKVDLVVRSSRTLNSFSGGFPDVVTIQSVSGFFGNGDGSFHGEQVIATARTDSVCFGNHCGSTGDRIAYAAVGDFNGDGKVDVAIQRIVGATPKSGSFEIALGKGNGGYFSLVVRSDLGFILAADDLNTDKLSDVVVAGASNDVEVLLNTSPTSGVDLGIIQSEVSTTADNLFYSASVLNDGPQDATGVTFTDTLPTGVNFVSATTTQGSCVQSHGIVGCTLGALASAGDAQFTILAAPTTGGTITNSMNVTANEPDPLPANNTATQISTLPPIYNISVTLAGNGTGSVTSVDGSINCATTGGICSAPFSPAGISVPLTATPSGHSSFVGWSGACTGTDPNSCSVTLNSNQSVTATFTMPPDFTPTPAAMNLTMKRGGQVTDVLTFPAQGGFSGTIALMCSVSGPSPMPTCGISPASVTPGTNATLTVNAAALSTQFTVPGFEQGARLSAACLPLGLFAFVLAMSFDKKRWGLWALCILLLVATVLPVGCGSASSGPPPPVVQNYTVTVTATSGTLQHSTTISVTVN